MRKFLPIMMPIAELVVGFILPRDSYIKRTCWSTNPPACSFDFSPSPVFFLAVALPFIVVITLALWRRWKETAVLSISASIALLVGLVFLYPRQGVSLLIVVTLSTLLPWGLSTAVKTPIKKAEWSLWVASAVLSFLTVWGVVQMGMGQAV